MLSQSRPLDGVVVIDLAQDEAGASCAQLLAWLGADVLKVEPVSGGDASRRHLTDVDGEDALGFLQFNSNKKSIALDIDAAADRALFKSLLSQADVLVDDGVDDLDRSYGVARSDFLQINPGLILASATLPSAYMRQDNSAADAMAQALGGGASTTGFAEGPPVLSGASVGASNAGMHACIGILTALYQRQQTGQGQTVSVSMPDAVLNLCRVKLRDQQRLDYLGVLSENVASTRPDITGSVPRIGNASGGGQPGMMIPCQGQDTDQNAYVYFINQDHNWPSTCDALGKPEWKTDPIFSTVPGRMTRASEVVDAIEAIAKNKNKHEAQDYFDSFGIPCAAVADMKEILHDPALRKSAGIVEVPHPTRGAYFTVGCPISFSGFKPEITAAPSLGQHNDVVLKQYSE